jgi:heat shock protein HslJ
MRNFAARLIVVSVLISISACGERTIPTEPGGAESYDGTWELVEGQGPEGEVTIVTGYRITLTINGQDAGGTAACNSYGGNADIEGTSFRFGGGGMTDMGCEPDVMEAEAAYISALQAADSIARDGDRLTLTGTDTELRFEIEPPLPTAELTDTIWKLESLIYGTGADGTAASAEPAELLIKSDGTLTGTTGCRDLYGEWQEDGDEITFTTFGAEGNCPKELRDQDGHVVQVLGDGFVPTIEEDRLTVISQGNLGLQYRAAK